MHQDQKIGLSLAVLLIGFAGAFCFRHDPSAPPQSLILEQAEELDARIEHLSIRAYTEREGVGSSRKRDATSRPVPAPDGPLADVLEIGRPPRSARRLTESHEGNLIAIFAGPPDPLPNVSERPAPRLDQSGGAVRTAGAATGGPPGASPRAESPSPRHDVWTALTAQTTGAGRDLSTVPLSVGASAARRESIDREATSTPPDAPAQQTHVVCPGDTLSELALRFLGSSHRYHELYEANRDVLSSPHALKPGMVLRIPTAE